LIASVKGLLDNGVDPATISKQVLPQLGFKKDSLPDELHNLLKEN
jgi:hypothetical protein